MLAHKIVDGKYENSVKIQKLGQSTINKFFYDSKFSPESLEYNQDNPSLDVPEIEVKCTTQQMDSLDETWDINIPEYPRCTQCGNIYLSSIQLQRHLCQCNVKCKKCNQIFKNKDILSEHIKTVHDESKKICTFCSKKFVSESRLNVHQENHCKNSQNFKFYRSDITVWECSHCHEIFSHLKNAIYHTERFHHLRKDIIQEIKTEILLQCEFCNRTFTDKIRLVIHQRSHSVRSNYVCCTCLTQFDSYPSATSHWNTKCSEYSNEFCLTKSLYCEFCDKTFRTHECLYTHKIKKKHITPKLNSDVCLETLQSGGYWDGIVAELSDRINTAEKENVRRDESNTTFESDEDHDLTSSEPKKKRRTRKSTASDPRFRYQCERCIKHCDTISSLEHHRAKEHANMFMCMECGATMASSKSLVIHDRCHKKLKPYVCDLCSKSYSQTSHLWQHMRFHNGIKPFACPQEGCNARYTIRPDLKDHIRKVHTRERPFQCTWCNKSFLTGSVFYQHRLIHTNDRRYECNVCMRRFFRADALNNHKRIHTDERPFQCDICGKNFRQKGDRNKHVKTQHPDMQVN